MCKSVADYCSVQIVIQVRRHKERKGRRRSQFGDEMLLRKPAQASEAYKVCHSVNSKRRGGGGRTARMLVRISSARL